MVCYVSPTAMKLRIQRELYTRLCRLADMVENTVGEYAWLRWKHRARESDANLPEDGANVADLLTGGRDVVMTVDLPPGSEKPEARAFLAVLASAVVRVERRMKARGFMKTYPEIHGIIITE